MGRPYLVIFISSVLILLYVRESASFGRGAPDSQCRSMIPQHNTNSQTSPSPFIIKLDKTSVKGGELVHVTLASASAGQTFHGFLTLGQPQSASYSETEKAFGTFRKGEDKNLQYVQCHSTPESGLTHTNNNPKATIEFDWSAPNEDGNYVILVTFVQDYNTFWVRVPSETIRVTKDTNLQAAPANPSLPAAGTSTVRVASPEVQKKLREIYSDCEKTKGCFGLPGGCIKSESCKMVTTFQNKAGKHHFQLAGELLAPGGYVATGLSHDAKMSISSTTACILPQDSSKPIIRSYLSTGLEEKVEEVSGNGFKYGETAFIDGKVYCEFQIDNFYETHNVAHVLDKQFRIFLTSGLGDVEEYLSMKHPSSLSSSKLMLLDQTPLTEEMKVQNTNSLDELLNRFYTGCGVDKGCFGLPNPRCVNNRNCELFTSFNEDRQFQVIGRMPTDYDYIAVGLSVDASMGQDVVTGCFVGDTGPTVGSFYNSPLGKFNAAYEDSKRGIETVSIVQDIDGYIFCEFTRSSEFNTDELDREFNLDKEEFHIMLSRGRVSSSGLGVHPSADDKSVSSAAVSLSYIGILGAASNILVELHGCFMIMAWLLCASTGMFTARYYKQTHTSLNPLNKAFWFLVHITCMFTTVFLTICGIIFIFVEVGGYSKGLSGAASWHPVLGLILLGLAVCQVIIAFFRPHPGTSKRPIFNWIHWTIGNVAHIVGIACIFLAEELSKSGLNGYKRYIFVLVGFVVFHVVMHVIMSIHTVWADKQMDVQNRMRAARPGPMKPSGKSDEAPGTGFRTAMLSLYLIGAAAVAITLVAFVASKL